MSKITLSENALERLLESFSKDVLIKCHRDEVYASSRVVAAVSPAIGNIIANSPVVNLTFGSAENDIGALATHAVARFLCGLKLDYDVPICCWKEVLRIAIRFDCSEIRKFANRSLQDLALDLMSAFSILTPDQNQSWMSWLDDEVREQAKSTILSDIKTYIRRPCGIEYPKLCLVSRLAPDVQRELLPALLRLK